MLGLLSAPRAILFQLDLALNCADILARPIIVALAHGALKTD